MPTLRNLSISHALQYFDDDIKKKEAKGFDYYSQEDSGIWFGKTAEILGLINKEFSREDYHNIMKGKIILKTCICSNTFWKNIDKLIYAIKIKTGREYFLKMYNQQVSVPTEVRTARSGKEIYNTVIHIVSEKGRDEGLLYMKSMSNEEKKSFDEYSTVRHKEIIEKRKEMAKKMEDARIKAVREVIDGLKDLAICIKENSL